MILGLVGVGCNSLGSTVKNEATSIQPIISPTQAITQVVMSTPAKSPTSIPTTLPSPTIAVSNALSEMVTVEFVSEPLSNLDSGAWHDFEPRIAVGDVTGDSQPEIFAALQGGDRTEEESVFWRHPVVLSWNGTTFKKLEVNWVGITPPASGLSTADRQGLPMAVEVMDIDQDGKDEVIVGTLPYRNASERGALYIFHWNGSDFVAEYSDYCMGSVYRLDKLGQGSKISIAISTMGRPVADWAEYEQIRPEVSKGLNEPSNGLYILRAVEPNLYQTQPLALDNDRLTSLIINTKILTETQFIRFEANRAAFRWNWATAESVGYGGQTINMGNILPKTEQLARYMAATDLNRDGIDEIIVLSGKNTYLGNVFIWQVFQRVAGNYQLIFESPETEPMVKGIISFTMGDVDNDNSDEIIDNTGAIYNWNNNRLCYQGNLAEAVGNDLFYGLESIRISDVYGDGKNRIIFTGRYAKNTEETCPDFCKPRLYVVSLNSALPIDVCLLQGRS